VEGIRSGILEIVGDHDHSTYRAVYTVRSEKVIYVLHCFQKKSPRGIKTALPDIELIDRRLRAARDDYEARYDAS
jgi:phage-related protein